MDKLFEMTLSNAPLVAIYFHLLGNQTVSVAFAEALSAFLMDRQLPAMAQPSTPGSQLVLKLFSLLLHTVAKFSDCEAVLRPHVAALVEYCLTQIRVCSDPTAYVRLLRYLFRALSQAKFELLYREFVPLLPAALDTLIALLSGPDGRELHDPVLELCLSLPARLSTLLPHLPRLMPPLVAALRGGRSGSVELQLLGLRTFEYWTDSMKPEFLEPRIAEARHAAQHRTKQSLSPPRRAARIERT